MLDELSKQNTRLSEDLRFELLFRLKERRSSYSDVLQFLHKPDEWKKTKSCEDKYDLFNRTSKIGIINLLAALIECLSIDNNTEVVDSLESDTSEEDLVISTLSMQELLALAIKKTDMMVVEKRLRHLTQSI